MNSTLIETRCIRAARNFHAACALGALVLCAMPQRAPGLSLELTGQARLRPQELEQALVSTSKAVMFDDETCASRAVVRFSTMQERNAFSNNVSALVLQRQSGSSHAWTDVRLFFTNSAKPPASVVKPSQKLLQPVPRSGIERSPDAAIPRPAIPNSRQPATLKSAGPPFDVPKTTTPGIAFDSPSLDLPVGTAAIRAVARFVDGTTAESASLRVEVRPAPAVLTLLAMGGACGPPPVFPDGNTDSKDLAGAGIRRDASKCPPGVQATFLADLTPMASVNCNNPCDTGCMSFLEHLALRLMNARKLANELDCINNAGTAMCDRRVNAGGIRNRIVFGKWRNTEEEAVCGTPIKFNKIIDDFVGSGGGSLILVGQSLGGAKLTKMVRDNWRWGNALNLELFALWDATSLAEDGLTYNGHLQPDPFKPNFSLTGKPSFGVRRVGSRPRRVLTFFQYSDALPFQNGAPLDPAEHHDWAEQHDLDECFSHNGIARSQFVHQRTAEVVMEALSDARNRARR